MAGGARCRGRLCLWSWSYSPRALHHLLPHTCATDLAAPDPRRARHGSRYGGAVGASRPRGAGVRRSPPGVQRAARSAKRCRTAAPIRPAPPARSTPAPGPHQPRRAGSHRPAPGAAPPPGAPTAGSRRRRDAPRRRPHTGDSSGHTCAAAPAHRLPHRPQRRRTAPPEGGSGSVTVPALRRDPLPLPLGFAVRELLPERGDRVSCQGGGGVRSDHGTVAAVTGPRAYERPEMGPQRRSGVHRVPPPVLSHRVGAVRVGVHHSVLPSLVDEGGGGPLHHLAVGQEIDGGRLGAGPRFLGDLGGEERQDPAGEVGGAGALLVVGVGGEGPEKVVDVGIAELTGNEFLLVICGVWA